MRPDYHRAIIDTVRYYGWKKIIYLYDSHDGKLAPLSLMHFSFYAVSIRARALSVEALHFYRAPPPPSFPSGPSLRDIRVNRRRSLPFWIRNGYGRTEIAFLFAMYPRRKKRKKVKFVSPILEMMDVARFEKKERKFRDVENCFTARCMQIRWPRALLNNNGYVGNSVSYYTMVLLSCGLKKKKNVRDENGNFWFEIG